jgi:hypothetical protein
MGLGRILWCFVPLALSFALIYYLEDRVNHWFAPFTNPSASPSPGATASSDPGKVGSAQVYRGPHRKRFKVLIDPGHGGRAERRSPTTGDNWDPVAGEFLAPYMGGGSRICWHWANASSSSSTRAEMSPVGRLLKRSCDSTWMSPRR